MLLYLDESKTLSLENKGSILITPLAIQVERVILLA
jgi:hypothetical protein